MVDNWKVYDLVDSLVASGLPMSKEYSASKFSSDVRNLEHKVFDAWDTTGLCVIEGEKEYVRAYRLANNATGSGHNNFLAGILVSMNVTASVKWWEQFQRYNFKKIVSSMSTMHRLRPMLEEGLCKYAKGTDMSVVEAFEALKYKEGISDEALAMSCPMGLLLTARVTTNYLQLRTMYQQRKNHKLSEWQEFCKWIEQLPYAESFITQ